MFSGGALQRMTIFALNIMRTSRYPSSQLKHYVARAGDEKEGEVGRTKINQCTLSDCLLGCDSGVVLSVLKAYQAQRICVNNPGLFFHFNSDYDCRRYGLPDVAG